jgi:hypothetical protein
MTAKRSVDAKSAPLPAARASANAQASSRATLEHDPESGYRFSEKIMLNQKLSPPI